MLLFLIIFLPFFSGIFLMFTKNIISLSNQEQFRFLKPFISELGFKLFIGLILIFCWIISFFSYLNPNTEFIIDTNWIPSMGARFHLELLGLSRFLVLLTCSITILLFVISSFKNYLNPEKDGAFWGLLLLSYSGLIGVFTSQDVLLFYFFWELVLIPIYFLCAYYGKGEKKVFVATKLFIYTFSGSILMLAGILLTVTSSPNSHLDFSYLSFLNHSLSTRQENIAFWLIFIGFAVKVPMFPLHSWQPEAYSNAPLPVTIFMSSLLVKMGLYGMIVWLLPAFKTASVHFATLISSLAIIGSIYASIITLKQTHLKKWIAYGSIAHLGIMIAGIFSFKDLAKEGVFMQMFNHGFVVLGLWLLAMIYEIIFSSDNIDSVKGLARYFPSLTLLIFITLLANLALPLTNSFQAEFLMLSGIFSFNHLLGILAVLTVIFTAIYTLTLAQKSLFGKATENVLNQKNIPVEFYFVYVIIAIFIFASGITPFYNYLHLY